jgi:hypothetical protein
LQQVRPEAAIARGAGDGDRTGTTRSAWPGRDVSVPGAAANWEAFQTGLGKKLRGNIGY